MFTTTNNLKGLVVRATDGELGTVDQLYFDDESWAVRYLTLETGGWLGGKSVLISPMSVRGIDWQARRLEVALTMHQVEHSPSIDRHRPVSRQHEAAYLGYYGYPYYWDGPALWGPSYSPAGFITDTAIKQQMVDERMQKESGDSHLHSTEEVAGYYLHAEDGEVGHIDQFIVDAEAWAIRYLEVATQNWWPGKKVLLSPEWVDRISWAESQIYVSVSRSAIRTCPEYLDSMAITRDYEDELYRHYGHPPYWKSDYAHDRTLSQSAR